jgi:hypothetical protein
MPFLQNNGLHSDACCYINRTGLPAAHCCPQCSLLCEPSNLDPALSFKHKPNVNIGFYVCAALLPHARELLQQLYHELVTHR